VGGGDEGEGYGFWKLMVIVLFAFFRTVVVQLVN